MPLLSLLSFFHFKHFLLGLLMQANVDTEYSSDPLTIAIWVIHSLSVFSVLIPLIVGYRRRDVLEKGLRLLLILLFISLCVELLALGVTFLQRLFEYQRENFFLYTLFTPVEFILFVKMFQFWNRGHRREKIFSYSIPVFLLVWAGGMIWAYVTAGASDSSLLFGLKKNIWHFENFLLSALSIFFIISAIMTLFTGLKDHEQSILSKGMFWFSAAILIYYAGNIFVFTLMDLILGSKQSFWYINTVVNFLKNILFAFAFYYSGKAALKERRTVDAEIPAETA